MLVIVAVATDTRAVGQGSAIAIGEMVALGAEELPIAADFDEPVRAGDEPGQIAVYSNGGRLVVLIDVEELVKNRLDLKRAS